MRTPFLIATLCLIFSIAPAYAGQLDNLEREATKSPSKSKSKKSDSNSKTSFSDELKNEVATEAAKALIKAAPDIITFGAKVIGYSALTVVAGAVGSHERSLKSQPEPTDNNEQDPENSKENKNKEFGADFFRVNGDPLLPTLRASTHGLYSGNNINAQLNRIEAGYSFLGISYSQNILNEDGDQLKLANTLIHYRMSLHNDFSWDFAYGRGKMNGNQKHDGSVFAMPIRLRFHPDWHFEYYPVWSSYKGGSLSEHQFSFNYHYKYIGANFGYKTWSAGTASVDGFFTGLYLSF
ncbi:MAG: hypothetical protein V7765_16640 [Oleispira sp.]